MNRTIFDLNFLVDDLLIRPIAEPYSELMPVFIQDIIRNIVRLADTPVNMANAILQGDVEAMENITARLLINLTLGVGGLFDVAADSGYPYRSEDFGQTLAVWGVDPGFYLVLPIFGPSSARDAGGRVVDIFFDPLTYLGGFELAGIDGRYDEARTASLAKTLANGIDLRARNIQSLDDLRRDSVDFYARVRSLWYQNRQAEIRNGRPGDAPLPDFPDEFLDDLEDEEEASENAAPEGQAPSQ
ncbi:MAG: VacJ family lipoprotein [Kiloniellales bacterium]|nr:VacJ family lipoprotein [Kiloniellales bacterium]